MVQWVRMQAGQYAEDASRVQWVRVQAMCYDCYWQSRGSQGDCPGCYGVEPVRADEVSLLTGEVRGGLGPSRVVTAW